MGAMWGNRVYGVKGVMEYFEKFFKVWDMFPDLGSHGYWVRVRQWCVVQICLGFLIFFWWEMTSGDDNFSDKGRGDWQEGMGDGLYCGEVDGNESEGSGV